MRYLKNLVYKSPITITKYKYKALVATEQHIITKIILYRAATFNKFI